MLKVIAASSKQALPILGGVAAAFGLMLGLAAWMTFKPLACAPGYGVAAGEGAHADIAKAYLDAIADENSSRLRCMNAQDGPIVIPAAFRAGTAHLAEPETSPVEGGGATTFTFGSERLTVVTSTTEYKPWWSTRTETFYVAHVAP